MTRYEKMKAAVNALIAMMEVGDGVRSEWTLDGAGIYRPAIERAETAGSLRRYEDTRLWAIEHGLPAPDAPFFKDGEIVIMTRGDASILPWLEQLEKRGLIGWALYSQSEGDGDGRGTYRRGPLYQGIVWQGMRIEIFQATRANWGYQLVLRTGNADFNMLIMTRVKPRLPYVWEKGNLWHEGRKLYLPDENAFFAACGLDYIPPRLRDEDYLAARLREIPNCLARARFEYAEPPLPMQTDLF